MKMNYLGRGMYSSIEKPGDFAYRIDGNAWLLAMHCPKFKVCLIPIHQAPACESPQRTWQWDGNEAEPTIVPSIGCDAAPRCGAHRTIQRGEIL